MCREYTSSNIVFQELLVDSVDDVRNDHADKVLTTLQSGKIICSAVSVGCGYGGLIRRREIPGPNSMNSLRYDTRAPRSV
jgi:hypothetical protein